MSGQPGNDQGFKSETGETTIMGFTVDGFNRAKSRMLSDFNKAITDADALRKLETDTPGGDPAATQVIIGKKPEAAGASHAEASPAAIPVPDTR
jgi:hypothetical protein